MKKYLLLRWVLLFVLVVGFGQAVLAQEGEENQPAKPARVMTNDDFGSPRPATPAPPPAPAPQPAKKTETVAVATPEEAKPKEEEVVETPRPQAVMSVSRDANGNWVMTSSFVAGESKTNAARSFSALTVSTGKPELDQLIQEAGQKHGVDPRLILEVMRQESGFKQYATSPAGAKGLMQFIRGTWVRYGVTNPYDPKQSIEAGARYLRDLLDMFNGNVELALAGYNAGEHRVIRNGYRVPQIRETQNYVKNITYRYGSKKHYGVKSTVGKKAAEPAPPPPMRVERDSNGGIFLTNH